MSFRTRLVVVRKSLGRIDTDNVEVDDRVELEVVGGGDGISTMTFLCGTGVLEAARFMQKFRAKNNILYYCKKPRKLSNPSKVLV